jgi:hypothetical protein
MLQKYLFKGNIYNYLQGIVEKVLLDCKTATCPSTPCAKDVMNFMVATLYFVYFINLRFLQKNQFNATKSQVLRGSMENIVPRAIAMAINMFQMTYLTKVCGSMDVEDSFFKQKNQYVNILKNFSPSIFEKLENMD